MELELLSEQNRQKVKEICVKNNFHPGYYVKFLNKDLGVQIDGMVPLSDLKILVEIMGAIYPDD